MDKPTAWLFFLASKIRLSIQLENLMMRILFQTQAWQINKNSIWYLNVADLATDEMSHIAASTHLKNVDKYNEWNNQKMLESKRRELVNRKPWLAEQITQKVKWK